MKICFGVNPDGTEVCTNDTYFGVGLFRHHETAKELIDKFGKGYEHCLKENDHWCNDFSNGYYTVPKFTGVTLPKGSVKLLTGKDLTWEDDPIMVEF